MSNPGETKHGLIVLGVNRRDVIFLGSFEDSSEAKDVALAGVLQSKFSHTFLIEAEVFAESAVNWANPDGVRIEPEKQLGAILNPDAGERESTASSEVEETSKREEASKIAEEQRKDGSAIDTGQPDKNLANALGKTSAFDAKPDGATSDSKPTAKSGEVSSSDVKTPPKPDEAKK